MTQPIGVGPDAFARVLDLVDTHSKQNPLHVQY